MSELPLALRRWDVFCTVVDNYGDIGVCWRLARQLVAERGAVVRLWVDDLASFARICPEVAPSQERQICRGVEIRHWPADFPPVVAADVVIEAFACELPPTYVQSMAEKSTAPFWFNLEYLSAEDWVLGCHGLPSPHPRLPLTKYFFFPGFRAGTGGLPCEAGLLARRRAFQDDGAAQAAFWQRLDLPGRQGDEYRIALFSYPNPALSALFQVWRASPRPVTCLIPEGTAAAGFLSAHFQQPALAGCVFKLGALTLWVHGFVDQADYDAYLWGCDLLFVRGEDSFVRAQWAARPFVWHIYPQSEDSHLDKLAAFLDAYCPGLAPEAAAGLRRLWRLWNQGQPVDQDDLASAWADFIAAREALGQHARVWAESLAEVGDLASNLVKFCETRL